MLAKACRIVAFYLSERFDSPPWPNKVGDAKLFIALTYQKNCDIGYSKSDSDDEEISSGNRTS